MTHAATETGTLCHALLLQPRRFQIAATVSGWVLQAVSVALQVTTRSRSPAPLGMGSVAYDGKRQNVLVSIDARQFGSCLMHRMCLTRFPTGPFPVFFKLKIQFAWLGHHQPGLLVCGQHLRDNESACIQLR